MAHIGGTLFREDQGNTEGRYLVVETKFAQFARTIPLSSLQKAMVVGSMLGDAMLMPTTSGSCFRVHHGREQRAYVDWKYAMLSCYVRTMPRECRNGYYFRTITHPEFSHWRGRFYEKNVKRVPMEMLEAFFTDLSLAVWVMDDGSVEGRQLRLNAQSFSIEEVEALCRFLRAKFGLDARVNLDKGRPRLRFVASSISRLVECIRPHIIPSMLYKVPL